MGPLAPLAAAPLICQPSRIFRDRISLGQLFQMLHVSAELTIYIGPERISQRDDYFLFCPLTVHGTRPVSLAFMATSLYPAQTHIFIYSHIEGQCTYLYMLFGGCGAEQAVSGSG